MAKVIIERIHEDAVMPRKGSLLAAGYDLAAIGDFEIPWGSTVTIPTGLKVSLPEGYELQVRSRSGLARRGVTVANQPATIDADYRGQLFVVLTYRPPVSLDGEILLGRGPFKVKQGDRIAQGVICKLPEVELVEGKVEEDTERGAGGFGSTGMGSQDHVVDLMAALKKSVGHE